MAKITKQEFENYNNQFLSTFARMMRTSEFKNQSREEQEKWEKFFGLLLNEIRQGNILVLYGSCAMAEDALNEDFSAIKKRAKEHIITRGYYNPASPLTLAEFRERRNKMGWKNSIELVKNKEWVYQLLIEMSEEDKIFIKSILFFLEEMQKFDSEEAKEWKEEKWKEIGFIWEDILKVLEEAQKKLENKQRERERERERAKPPTILPLSLTPQSKLIAK